MKKKHINDDSPWGVIQTCREIYPGFFHVTTAGHGGIMVEKGSVFRDLTAEARKIGFYENGFLCFEEDSAMAAPLIELITTGRYIPELKEAFSVEDFKRSLAETLKTYHPEYYQTNKHLLYNQGNKEPDKAR